MQLENDGMTS